MSLQSNDDENSFSSGLVNFTQQCWRHWPAGEWV